MLPDALIGHAQSMAAERAGGQVNLFGAETAAVRGDGQQDHRKPGNRHRDVERDDRETLVEPVRELVLA